MKRNLVYIVIFVLLIGVVIGFMSCGNGSKLSSMTVTPTTIVAATGTLSSQQYTATETLGDNSGSFNTTQIVAWQITNPVAVPDLVTMSIYGVATIDNNIPLASAQTATISAFDATNNVHPQTPATLMIADPMSTLVTPTDPYMAQNSLPHQFAGIATFSTTTTTQDLTSSSTIQWIGAVVSTGGLVTIGSTAAGTTVTIQANYTYTDTKTPPVTHGCVHGCGSSTITVTQSALLTLTIDPTIPLVYSVAATPQKQFTAQGIFVSNPPDLPTGQLFRQWIWASSNTAVATIDGNGLVTFVSPANGSTTIITATDPITGIQSAGVTITVNP